MDSVKVVLGLVSSTAVTIVGISLLGLIIDATSNAFEPITKTEIPNQIVNALNLYIALPFEVITVAGLIIGALYLICRNR